MAVCRRQKLMIDHLEQRMRPHRSPYLTMRASVGVILGNVDFSLIRDVCATRNERKCQRPIRFRLSRSYARYAGTMLVSPPCAALAFR